MAKVISVHLVVELGFDVLFQGEPTPLALSSGCTFRCASFWHSGLLPSRPCIRGRYMVQRFVRCLLPRWAHPIRWWSCVMSNAKHRRSWMKCILSNLLFTYLPWCRPYYCNKYYNTSGTVRNKSILFVRTKIRSHKQSLLYIFPILNQILTIFGKCAKKI